MDYPLISGCSSSFQSTACVGRASPFWSCHPLRQKEDLQMCLWGLFTGTHLTKDVFWHQWLVKGKQDVNSPWTGISEQHWKCCAYSWLLHPRLGSWNTRNDCSMLCSGSLCSHCHCLCRVVIAVYMCTQLSWMEHTQEVWCLSATTHTRFSLHLCYSYFSTYPEE